MTTTWTIRNGSLGFAGQNNKKKNMKTSSYVIRRADGQFWAGPGKWSHRYEIPEGHQFPDWESATREAIASTPACSWSHVIGDFGTPSERVVLKVNGSILGEPEPPAIPLPPALPRQMADKIRDRLKGGAL